MSETNVKTVKKIKRVASEQNFIGVDLAKGRISKAQDEQNYKLF